MTKRKRSPLPAFEIPPAEPLKWPGSGEESAEPESASKDTFEIPASIQKLHLTSHTLANQSDGILGTDRDDQYRKIVVRAQAFSEPPPPREKPGSRGRKSDPPQAFRAFAPLAQPPFPEAQKWVDHTPKYKGQSEDTHDAVPHTPPGAFGKMKMAEPGAVPAPPGISSPRPVHPEAPSSTTDQPPLTTPAQEPPQSPNPPSKNIPPPVPAAVPQSSQGMPSVNNPPPVNAPHPWPPQIPPSINHAPPVPAQLPWPPQGAPLTNNPHREPFSTPVPWPHQGPPPDHRPPVMGPAPWPSHGPPLINYPPPIMAPTPWLPQGPPFMNHPSLAMTPAPWPPHGAPIMNLPPPANTSAFWLPHPTGPPVVSNQQPVITSAPWPFRPPDPQCMNSQPPCDPGPAHPEPVPEEGEVLCLEKHPGRIAALIAQKRRENEITKLDRTLASRAATQLRNELNEALEPSAEAKSPDRTTQQNEDGHNEVSEPSAEAESPERTAQQNGNDRNKDSESSLEATPPAKITQQDENDQNAEQGALGSNDDKPEQASEKAASVKDKRHDSIFSSDDGDEFPDLTAGTHPSKKAKSPARSKHRNEDDHDAEQAAMGSKDNEPEHSSEKSPSVEDKRHDSIFSSDDADGSPDPTADSQDHSSTSSVVMLSVPGTPFTSAAHKSNNNPDESRQSTKQPDRAPQQTAATCSTQTGVVPSITYAPSPFNQTYYQHPPPPFNHPYYQPPPHPSTQPYHQPPAPQPNQPYYPPQSSPPNQPYYQPPPGPNPQPYYRPPSQPHWPSYPPGYYPVPPGPMQPLHPPEGYQPSHLPPNYAYAGAPVQPQPYIHPYNRIPPQPPQPPQPEPYIHPYNRIPPKPYVPPPVYHTHRPPQSSFPNSTFPGREGITVPRPPAFQPVPVVVPKTPPKPKVEKPYYLPVQAVEFGNVLTQETFPETRMKGAKAKAKADGEVVDLTSEDGTVEKAGGV